MKIATASNAALPTTADQLIWRAMRGRARNVVGGSLLMMGHQTGESLVPVMIGVIIDRAVGSGDLARLVPGVIGLALVFAFLSNSWRFGARLLYWAAKGAEHDLRVAVARRVLDPAGGADRDRLPGELLNIATIDAERVGRLANVIATAAGAFAALAVTTVVLLRISLPLGLLVLIGSMPLIALIQFLGRTLERASRVEQAGAARAAGIANDLVAGLRVLKGIGAEGPAIDRYRGASRVSLGATVRAAGTQATYQGLNQAITGAFIALVAYVGGRLAIEHKISIGDLIAALGLTQFLIGPLYRLTNVGANLARGRASAARIAALLDAPAPFASGEGLVPPGSEGRLEVRDLGHGSLSAFNLSAAAGESIGIVAPDPADAVSLLECLTGAAAPEAGVIEINGMPIAALQPVELRRALVVVPHDSYLFAETLAENVRAVAANPAVDWAILAADADEVAASLPLGIDSMITGGGRSLSGGQRQRVAVARALAADAPILVLHDPTTAVDSVTEARIASGIAAVRRSRTTIVISSSPALLSICDRIVFIDREGETKTAGHHDLLAGDARYREAVLS